MARPRFSSSLAYDKYVSSNKNTKTNNNKNNCSNNSSSSPSSRRCRSREGNSSGSDNDDNLVSPSMFSRENTRRSGAVIISKRDLAHEYATGRPTVILPLPSCLGLGDSESGCCPPPPSPPVRCSSTASTQSTSSYGSTSTTATSSNRRRRRHRGLGGRQTSINEKDDYCSDVEIDVDANNSSDKNNINNNNDNDDDNNTNTNNTVYNDPLPLRYDAWSEGDGVSYNVRGPTYLQDGGKKITSLSSIFNLLTIDLVQCISEDKPIMTGLCSHPNERIQKALRREKETGIKELPAFVFAINLVLPGPPIYHLVMYFGLDDMELIGGGRSNNNNNNSSSSSSSSSNNSNSNSETTTTTTTTTPFSRIAKKFFFGNDNDDDEYRSETFKLIPRITKGNFIVKNAVGSKPAILGKKLKQTYIRTDRYMELICDIGSNTIAQRIVRLSTGYAKSLEVEMAFVLEGKEVSTLPEQIMGVAVLKNIDFEQCDGKRKI